MKWKTPRYALRKISLFVSLFFTASAAFACGGIDDPCMLEQVDVDDAYSSPATEWNPFLCTSSNAGCYNYTYLTPTPVERWQIAHWHYGVTEKSYTAPGRIDKSCSDDGELRLAAANVLANAMIASRGGKVRKGDHIIVTTSDGYTETWDYICGGRGCAGTVINNSPSSSNCPVSI